MEPGFNPTGWIDDLRECEACGVDAEYLRQTSQPPLKPMPRALQGPKGLHCADCVEDWREVMSEAWAEEDYWGRQTRGLHHCAEPGCGQPCHPDSYGCAKHTD